MPHDLSDRRLAGPAAAYLRILDRNTGAVCVSLDGEALEELREQGDLDLQELSTNEPCVLKEQIRNLFLFSYARALRP